MVSSFQAKLDRDVLEIVAEREVAEHLEEGVVARGIADIVEIVVLAAGAHALLRRRRARCRRAFSCPVKTFLNCTMPALVNINVGSLRGTSGDDGNHLVAVLAEVVEEGAADLVDAGHVVLCCRSLGPLVVAALRRTGEAAAAVAELQPW